MTKLNKNQRAAQLAKELGYSNIATVVKQVFNTTYHNVQDVDHVIERGWSGAQRMPYWNGGRYGVNGNHVDWSATISRTQLFSLLAEKELN